MGCYNNFDGCGCGRGPCGRERRRELWNDFGSPGPGPYRPYRRRRPYPADRPFYNDFPRLF